MLRKFLRHARVLAPAEAGGGGADAGTQADAGVTPDPATATGAQPKWWEGERFSPDARTFLTAKGLTVDDPLDAATKLVEMQRNAESKLGRPADRLIERPKDGQDMAGWVKDNRAIFGLPEAPEGYKVERPADWPKDAAWDEGLEATARAIAHEEGLTPKALNRFIGAYAAKVRELAGAAETDLAAARTTMMTELERDWGAQAPAKIVQAQQAASVLAERAGIDQEGLLSIGQSLKAKVGDALVIKLFATIGDMLGDDAGVGLGKGGAGLGTTPAEARAQIAVLRGPEGAYSKAVATNNRAEIARWQPEIDRLTKIATGG